MFEGAFSFHGRIGRLRYFQNCLLLGSGSAVATLALQFLAVLARRHGVGIAVPLVCVGLCLAAIVWFSLSVQVRRIRDIGLDPFVVVIGWIAFEIGDVILSRLVPSLATGVHPYGTFLATYANLALSLALLFWPGRDDDEQGSRAPPNPRIERLGLSSGGAPGVMPAGMSARRRQGFGRRGLQ